MSDKQVVMVIDDNLMNVQVLAPILLTMGLEVSTLTDAKTVVKDVRNVSPDLILLDIIMPGVDGFEACRLLKDCDDTKDIPIIFLTAKREVDSVAEGFDLGGVDYIHKPFKSQELQARVKTHLALRLERRQRIANEQKLEKTVAELETKIREIELLQELLPICSQCKKIRDDKGYWSQVEEYFSAKSSIQFSHSLCPHCVVDLYPEIGQKVLNRLDEKDTTE
jgi:PleD family two-component response regulator